MKTMDSELSPAERIHDLPRIQAAVAQAVRDALEVHRLAGNPVAVWRDGRVQWIEARDIPTELATAEVGSLGDR